MHLQKKKYRLLSSKMKVLENLTHLLIKKYKILNNSYIKLDIKNKWITTYTLIQKLELIFSRI